MYNQYYNTSASRLATSCYGIHVVENFNLKYSASDSILSGLQTLEQLQSDKINFVSLLNYNVNDKWLEVRSRDRYNRKVKVQVRTENLFDLTFNLFPVTFQDFYLWVSDFRFQINQFQPFSVYSSVIRYDSYPFMVRKNMNNISENFRPSPF